MKYKITISNGHGENSFTMKADSTEDARRTAQIVHIGTGWHVVRVTQAKK